MKNKNEQINPFTYSKAIFIYVMTVGAAYATKASGILWRIANEEETETLPQSIKRNALQASTSQLLPLIQGTEIGRLSVSSTIYDLAVQNNTVYIAAGETGMYVFDVNNASLPIYHDHFSLLGSAHQIQISGSYAYVAYDDAGLRIIDISNPQNVTQVGVYMMGFQFQRLPVTQLAISGSKAFLAGGNAGSLSLIDVSDPTQVFWVFLNTLNADGIITFNSTVCINNGFALQFVDVTNPTDPQIVSYYNNVTYLDQIVVSGELIYAVDRSGSLKIIDASNASDPYLKGSIALGEPTTVSISGNYAYLSVYQQGLQIVDISNPFNLQLVGRYNTSQVSNDMIVVGGIAYVSYGNSGISLYNVTDPNSIKFLSGYGTVSYANIVDYSTGLVYVAAGQNLQIIHVNNPSFPFLAGIFTPPYKTCTAYDVTINNNTVYLTGCGLEVININNPTAPQLVKSYRTMNPSVVTVTDSIAYTGAYNGGLQVINLSLQPYKPEVVILKNEIIIDAAQQGSKFFYTATGSGLNLIDCVSCEITWEFPFNEFSFFSILIDGKRLYTQENNSPSLLNIYDITIPTSPMLLNSLISPGIIQAISNNIAFTSKNGLNMYNVSNPTQVQLILNYPTPSDGLLVITNQTLVLLGGRELMAFNITDINNIQLFGVSYYPPTLNIFFATLLDPVSVPGVFTVSNNRAYALSAKGVIVFDVSNPTNMSFRGVFPTSIFSGGTTGDNVITQVYAKDLRSSQVQIFNAADPTNFQLLSTYTSTNLGVAIVSNNFIYLAGNSLDIIDISDPTHPLFTIKYAYSLGNPIAFLGKYAYMYGAWPSGLLVLNLDFGKNTFQTKYTASQITALNDILYFTDTGMTLYILNVTDVTHPIVLSEYQLTNPVLDMITDSHYLYLAEGFYGVEILDITNATQPLFAAQITNGIANAKSLKVEGNRLYVIDSYQQVVILTIDPLFYLSGQMFIQQGQRLVVNSSDVAVTGFSGISASQLMMMAGNITHAQFELSTQPGVAIQNFTLAQVESGQVIFVQDGSKIAPGFNLLVTDGTTTKGPFTANVLFQPINYPPVLGNDFISINEGQSVILTLANFNATDDLTPAMQLIFVTTQQSNSQFEQTSQPGVIITRFSQQDIVNGYILFRHLDQSSAGDLTPLCTVSVFDGQLYSTSVPVQFIYHSSPKLIHNELTIYRGETLTISSNELQATDTQVQASTLIFIITNITHGSFTKNNFTQAEVAQGLIQFQHDGSEQSPSYEVSVEDPFVVTVSQPAVVTFTDKNSNLLLDAGGIGGTVVGGAVGLGLLIGGIFAYRNYARNEQSRKNDLFAAAVYQALKPVDAANFNSPIGRLFVNALKTLKTELSQLGIDVDSMGNWELNQLSEQITLAVQHEISSKKNWRGESIVDSYIISQGAPQLALAIQKIRAGVYEVSAHSM